MYRSSSYASQGGKSTFVEMAERSAEAARLLQEARATDPEQLAERKRSLARWAVSRRNHLLEGLGKRASQLRVEARGWVASSGPPRPASGALGDSDGSLHPG